MKKKYEVVIFDLDGTILDTLGDLCAAVNHALRKRNLPEHTMDEYRQMVGSGIRNLCRQALGGESEEVLDQSLADFKAYYVSHIDVYTRPYEGMVQLMTDLRAAGVTVAVASNKFREGALTLCRKFFPEIPESLVWGDVEGLPLKPRPDMIARVMQQFPQGTSCCMVGDSWTDIEAGKAYGCQASVGVSWGYRYTEALYKAGADAVADTMDDLRSLLLE
ncbi:MAG: HAD-IA family hydrolase [Bacteroidales bacterium]|nr:HAD-IA family hydrolase [Bacteroidales bacterium]